MRSPLGRNVWTETEILCAAPPQLERAEERVPDEKTFRVKVEAVGCSTNMEKIALFSQLKAVIQSSGIYRSGCELKILSIEEG